CERGAARLGGDGRRERRRAPGFGRGRARAGLRLAAWRQGRRREGVPDRPPRLLDREDPALGAGRPAPPPAPRPVAASPHTRASGARAARARGAGVLGTLGIGAGVLIGRIAGWRSLIPRRSPLPSSFSGVVGLGFGVYRARR